MKAIYTLSDGAFGFLFNYSKKPLLQIVVALRENTLDKSHIRKQCSRNTLMTTRVLI